MKENSLAFFLKLKDLSKVHQNVSKNTPKISEYLPRLIHNPFFNNFMFIEKRFPLKKIYKRGQKRKCQEMNESTFNFTNAINK